VRLALVVAACIAVGGCALSGKLEENGPGIKRTPPQIAFAAAQAASERVHIGDTRDAVAAALGSSNILQFESGWQVWIYRWPGVDDSTRAATELDLLFEPRGTLRKIRVRRGEAASTSSARASTSG
jgi:hypothetical protein